MEINTCCFFGHKAVNETKELKTQLYAVIEKMIIYENIYTFLLGSKSRFNDICCEVLAKIKEKYPHIKRVYVRAEYPNIDDDYREYLLKSYDDTYYPEGIRLSGKAAYVERNCEMINRSRFCIIYYDEVYTLTKPKSGTKIALDYAIKKGKRIINTAKL